MLTIVKNKRFSWFMSILFYFIGMGFSISIFGILQLDFGTLIDNENLKDWHVIFMHNYRINLLIISGGILLCIPTALILLINGFVSGFHIIHSIHANSFLALIERVAPHGIFEVPSTIISGALAFQLTVMIYRKLFLKTPINKTVYIRYFYLFLLMTALTLIGALIEA
ncbi:stage II sporulation protein M [Bacillus sp. FJAT-47783]|uniref:stage II sporulation protein M n=1 Tax=Bacillus sp. FJAT-47783 TaxID=2922712 RepID=UPI001FAB7368|nr:stage II sporulation protein M [Bacillus sp. FJAT-47783]